MGACLRRIDSLKKNYKSCEDKCEGDACAEIICKETARNIACEAIRARCSSDGDNIDPDYTRCCGNECLSTDEAPCRILPTTTSSTSVTTSTSTSLFTTTTSP